MEIKKKPEVDLESYRIIMLLIGLIVALGIVVAVLSYSKTKVEPPKEEEKAVAEVVENIEITRQDQKPPEPPKKVEIKVITDVLNVVTNDTKIDTKVDFAEFAEDVEFIQTVAVEEEQIEEEQIFVRVEKMPSFMGGDLATFRNWVMSKLRYPQIAQENGISGRVFLEFVVEKDGSLTKIKVLQSPDQSLSDEAVRVLKLSPKWTPGQQRSQSVRVKYTLPVDFRIQN